ncbi:histidine triad nucleotide-binding protein [Bifidobacterium aemilianum]|uniref:Histidine triad nucleotide-binding protein n=1 Tax=Bifidobacterium aemilianum TaxID=2493120 RepID=A0A366K9F6_9BIFI|nr:histidine triad nucleotide-binding protein [Bifidobacterium aemilianum]RBP98324.1 histidine triad nucleotide-binding protein [Bifidobacterium aemilianum]
MRDQDDCLFCKIIAGEVPSSKVYEDETVYAFNDIEPKAQVHVLVVPKQHYANVAQVAAADPQLLAHMVQVAQGVAAQSHQGQFRLIFNTGQEAGQSVFHAHGHVLAGDNLATMPMAGPMA